jgi:hypothetical protein
MLPFFKMAGLPVRELKASTWLTVDLLFFIELFSGFTLSLLFSPAGAFSVLNYY